MCKFNLTFSFVVVPQHQPQGSIPEYAGVNFDGGSVALETS